MKAVLVIDMPKDCRRCQLMVDRFCYGVPMDEVHDNININERPKWCPLRPLPQKKKYEEPTCLEEYKVSQMLVMANADGWNACLDAITGETE